MKRLLLVEDDRSLGQTLSERLRKEGYTVDWELRLSEARQRFAEARYDLIILDVGLPDGSGFEFAREVRKASAVPFVFVTAQTAAEDRLAGYEIGAEEYIPKPFLLKELLLRVRHVLENHAERAPRVFGAVTVDFDSRAVIGRDGRREALAQKEFEVLRILIERSPAVVSRDEILDKVWGEEKFPSQRTVDNVILRLRQVLGPEVGKAIKSVRGVGYQWLLEGDGDGQ